MMLRANTLRWCQQRGIEDGHVRGVGQRAAVDRRIVGQRRGGAHPDIEPVALLLLSGVAAEMENFEYCRNNGDVRRLSSRDRIWMG